MVNIAHLLPFHLHVVIDRGPTESSSSVVVNPATVMEYAVLASKSVRVVVFESPP